MREEKNKRHPEKNRDPLWLALSRLIKLTLLLINLDFLRFHSGFLVLEKEMVKTY
jgi:hypothetical protein